VTRPLRVFLAAGESSGDAIGAQFMQAMRRAAGETVAFSGIGGPKMAGEGLSSLFPASDIAVMGPRHVLPRLPLILRRLREATEAVLSARPDVLVVIDSPEFTQRLARRVRARAPEIPIVKYVAPQIWAWRPGRGRRMRPYIDDILALLPFEPAVYARLGGPRTHYIGHPLIETVGTLRPGPDEAVKRARTERPLLLILPGSRVSEVARLTAPFGAAAKLIVDGYGPVEIVVPAVDHLAERIRAAVAAWPVPARVVTGEAEKRAAFRSARAALAASGTVTLELGLAGVPTVVGYEMEPLFAMILRRLIVIDEAVLANLVLGERVMPQFLQERMTPRALAGAVLPLLAGGPERERQIEAFARLDRIMEIGGEPPSDRAARIVLAAAQRRPVIGT